MIGDRVVARYYLRLCKRIGLDVSLHKSVSSKRGLACEFAKRTFYKGVDVSPITLKGYLMAKNNVSSLIDFLDPMKTGVLVFLRSYGYGYRVLSKVWKKFSSLKAHAKFRDRLFTYQLVKDLRTDGSVNQAMGRDSLRFINRVTVRGFQMGGMLAESSYFFKYNSLISLSSLLAKADRVEAKIRDAFKNSDVSALGLGLPRDESDRSLEKGCFDPFFKVLATRYFKSWNLDSPRLNDPTAMANFVRPFLFESLTVLKKLDKIRNRVDYLRERLRTAKGADFFKEYIRLDSELSSFPTSGLGARRDPLMKTEWTVLTKLFHLVHRVKKPR